MLTNEQRAHDLACAVISNNVLFEKFIKANKISKYSNFAIYQELYKMYLSKLDKHTD